MRSVYRADLLVRRRHDIAFGDKLCLPPKQTFLANTGRVERGKVEPFRHPVFRALLRSGNA